MITNKRNIISEIRNGDRLEEHLSYVKRKLFIEGAVNTSVLEIISYLKVFQPHFFSEHESEIIEMMGLYFKHPKSDSFVNLLFTDYGEYIYQKYGKKFTPIQADILKKINSMHTFSFSAPTSTGKSFVFRELIKNAEYDVAVIVPSRALINEYYDRVLDIVNSRATNVLTFVEVINTKHAKQNVFILTPERARELFKQKHRLNIGLVLFDEAQLSDEDSVRGLYFDSIVRRVQKTFPNAKCVFAHPFISNPEAQLTKNQLNENADAIYYEYKNVGQIFYTHDVKLNKFHHFGIEKSIMGEYKVQSKFDPIFEAIKKDGSVLIFVSKTHIYNNKIFANYQKYIALCHEVTNPDALELIARLQSYVGATNGTNSNYVSKILECLKRGIVIHHGSIPLKARLILEHFTQQGFCRICFATSTLEQGINMPFDVVYLDKFLAGSPLSVKNLIGRAGRSTSDDVFDVGAVVVKQASMSNCRKLVEKIEKISVQSHLDKEDEKLDEKYNEYKEAIKTDQFNDEYNLTNKDVQKLSSDEISATVATLLDLMFDDNGNPIYPQWESEEKNDRKAMYDDFHSLYQQYLGGRELTKAEKSILSQAVKIMMWRVFKKTFKLICQYRYDYASRKKERSSSSEDFSKLQANFLRGYADIPDKTLANHSLFADTPAELVDYDLVIYDTYDYLDKLIGFKLSDIYYAIFHQYYLSTGDLRASRLAKYMRFGTDVEQEIWMLKYGLTFEDIEWASICIDSINEQEIVFNQEYKNLDEDEKAVLSRYYHESTENV